MIVLDDPIGKVTFTALTRRSINIQIDNGTKMGPYEKFLVQKHVVDVCEIPFRDPLNDCTDAAASFGQNWYELGAYYTYGLLAPLIYMGDTLIENRKRFIPINAHFPFTMDDIFFACTLSATKKLTSKNRGQTYLSIVYIPSPGEKVAQMVVRSEKRGRFYGNCGTAKDTCTATGLVPGVKYEIWVRSCLTFLNVTQCRLLAHPLRVATRPARKLNCSLMQNAHLP